MMRRLAEWVCLAIYGLAPIAAIGGLVWFTLISNRGFLGGLLLGSLCFFGFGFLGMFARGWAQQLAAGQRR